MHYQPTILPTHRSSSQGFRTQKPHQGRKLNQTPLPVVSNTRQEQRPRINLQESRYRVDRYFPNGATKSTSMVKKRYLSSVFNITEIENRIPFSYIFSAKI